MPVKIIAAGGLVTNENNELLMIFRRGKWDLPKGKLDKGETIEECAIREVEEETGIGNHMTCPSMIGVTIIQNITYNNLRLIFPDHADQCKLVLLIIAKKSIAHLQVFPDLNTNDFCSSCRFSIAGILGAAGSQFSLGKINNPGYFASPYFVDKYPGTSQFYVVRMYAYGKNVKFHETKIER